MARLPKKKVDQVQAARDQEAARQAQTLMARGRMTEAAQILDQLHRRYPDEPSIVFNLGMARMGQLHHDEARRLLEIACRNSQAPADAHAVLAVNCLALQDVDATREHVEIALGKDPNSERALRVKAEMLNIVGEADEGVRLMTPIVERDLTNGQNVATLAKCLRSCDRREEAVDLLERAAEAQKEDGESRAAILYELAAEYEKLGRYDDAWQAGQSANSMRPSSHTKDGWEEWIDQRIEAFSAERMPKLPRSRRSGEGKIFIVGMPRSGTTLVEQIIASHPEAFGIGERQFIPYAAREMAVITRPDETQTQRLDSIKPAGVDRIARRVLSEMNEAEHNARVVVDKLMQNFLHLGIIEMLLPGAKIIHCMRDPRDTCVSCFLQHFPGPENQAYSRDVETLAHYYRQYRRIMSHWKGVLSLEILDVRYEDIVADKEREARRLIDFAGLEWDEACLHSHQSKRTVVTLSADQVRRPMYTSSMGRFERYRAHLGPISDLA